MKPGKYVVIEGHDGTGKSTQVGLIRQRLLQHNIDSIEFHEPAGSPMADEIRNVIKNGSLQRDAMTNLLLFSAARHEIWQKQAVNNLNQGKWVIASRNYYSTLAYQGYGEGLSLDIITDITRQSTDDRYMNPDIAIILDMDDEKERSKRINIRGELENPDTFESKDNDFQAKVRNAYLKIAKSRNIPLISANQTIDKMTNEIWEHIKP
jgi:dTMP kinase